MKVDCYHFLHQFHRTLIPSLGLSNPPWAPAPNYPHTPPPMALTPSATDQERPTKRAVGSILQAGRGQRRSIGRGRALGRGRCAGGRGQGAGGRGQGAGGRGQGVYRSGRCFDWGRGGGGGRYPKSNLKTVNIRIKVMPMSHVTIYFVLVVSTYY